MSARSTHAWRPVWPCCRICCARRAPMESEPAPSEPPAEPHPQRFGLSLLLFVLTCVSTTFVPAFWFGQTLREALSYAVPLMAILLAHELGHYIAARIHSVPSTPPFFIPVPLPPLGT